MRQSGMRQTKHANADSWLDNLISGGEEQMKQDLLGGVIVLATLCLLFCIRSFILSVGRHPDKQPVLKSAAPKNEHSGRDTSLGVSQIVRSPSVTSSQWLENTRPQRHKE